MSKLVRFSLLFVCRYGNLGDRVNQSRLAEMQDFNSKIILLKSLMLCPEDGILTFIIICEHRRFSLAGIIRGS